MGHQLLLCPSQVLEWSGGVLDALSIAVRAALANTRVPRLTVSGEGEEVEIEVSDNPHDTVAVNAGNAPLIITLTQVSNSPSMSLLVLQCLLFSLRLGTILLWMHL